MAVPSSDALKAVTLLTSDPRNVVWFISGRGGEFLEQHLDHVKGLGMSAEHGGFMRDPGVEKWSNLTEELDMSWMAEVNEVFKYYTEVCVCFVCAVLGCVLLMSLCIFFLDWSRGQREVILRLRRALLLGITEHRIRNGGMSHSKIASLSKTKTNSSLVFLIR